MVAEILPAFLGRSSECEVLERLLENVRRGESAVLVVHGESGIGKTALLRHVAQRASGFRVAEIAGVESEMELAFAGLHQLCAPMLARVDSIPSPQRDALRVAFGLSPGAAPEHFMLGLALLSLLSEVAAEQPLLCLVDDAQWLDGATRSLLGFVARRLFAESVALVFVVRQQSEVPELAGLPELVLGGLTDGDARALLEMVIPGRLDDRVRERIISETRGNPLALLELPHGTSAAALAGGFVLPSQRDIPGEVEEQFRGRIASLPEATRRLMLLASADPVGEASVLSRAARALGLEITSVQPARDAQLLEFGAPVRFRHPLVRSAAYWSGSATDRQAAHGALASAIDPDTDPDRRCWHRAHATTPPNEEIAGELSKCADDAQRRGGIAAAAAFLERAVSFTPDSGRRALRALTAAGAKLAAGDLAAAESLLVKADVGPLDETGKARVVHMRGQIAFDRQRGRDAPALLLQAAKQFDRLDVTMARKTYLEALLAAIYAADLAASTSGREIARTALSAPLEAEPSAIEGLLLALALRLTDGHKAAAPAMKQSLSSYLAREPQLDWSSVAYELVAMELWDDQAWFELASNQAKLARATGTLVFLPYALDYLANFYIQAGALAEAAELVTQAELLDSGTRRQTLPYTPLRIAAWQGQTSAAERLVAAMIHGAQMRGEGCAISAAQHAESVLYNGLGHYELALGAAQNAAASDELVTSSWALGELVEAASRSGHEQVAQKAADELSERTDASGTAWAKGTGARSRALTEQGEAAEDLYREAIDSLGNCRMAAHLARGRLNYGEWLRRQGRRVQAREQLHDALDMFTTMGAQGFAERTRRELVASGGKVRKRRDDERGKLTPQEEQIAQLACDGRTNSEIAAELYLSSRTIEWHLGGVFAKLGISSRRELAHALASRERQSARS